MTQDAHLADRIRGILEDADKPKEKRMFGGIAFLIGGNLAIAASGQGGLLVRVDPEEAEALLAEDGAGPMTMRGKDLEGWLRVNTAVLDDPAVLEHWVATGVRRARSLPSL
jgi:TfoX/Sxy family transcriptional regulator of competence genes